MIKLAVILTHNKGNAENFNQIKYLKTLIVKQTETHPASTDPHGNTFPAFQTYYYTLKGLAIPHEAKFYQIFPYGVTLPTNKDQIDSYKVYYGKGDEDKTGDHSRFYNWGLKRGTDYGADLVIHINNYKYFTVAELPFILNTLTDPFNNMDFYETTAGKFTTNRILAEVGQLDESKPMTQSIETFKTQISIKGFINGS